VCRSPSAGNLIQNSGFSTSLSSWTGSATWQGLDADGCPNSGSALVQGNVSGAPSQCVQVAAYQSYYFGLSVYSSTTFDQSECELDFFHDTACSTDWAIGEGAVRIGPQGTNSTTGWHSYSGTTTAPMDAVSASIGCWPGSHLIYVDQVYLNTTNSY
jgi:hypothetical protein